VGTPEEDVRGPLYPQAYHHIVGRHPGVLRHCPDLQGQVDGGCRALGTRHHMQDGGGATGDMGSRGSRPSGEGGGAHPDVFLGLGPYCLLGSAGAQTRHRDRQSG
jgi:hypothetical protein